MKPFSGNVMNVRGILELLSECEKSGDIEKDLVYKFKKHLQRHRLISVLLVRTQGRYWERIGSGLMLEKDWPSTSEQAKIRAYKEHMVLI